MKLTKAQIHVISKEIQKKIRERVKEQKESFLLSEEYREEYEALMQANNQYRIAHDVFMSYPTVLSVKFEEGYYTNYINKNTIQRKILERFKEPHINDIEDKIILTNIDETLDVESLINNIVQRFT